MKENKTYIPPIKIQGIKTKLLPFIKENILINNDTVWVEPFMGSGVVGFNIAPQKAIFCDTNPHIIQFYNDLKDKIISSKIIKNFLEQESLHLQAEDDIYYYKVRERFNKHPNSLDFLFLNRSCFNGMMRFNRKGEFNVPYCHKPKRFSKAYITKIVHQIQYVENMLEKNDWQFLCQPFEKTIELTQNMNNVFIYCDPPYINRNSDYFDSWNIDKERILQKCLSNSNAKFMISTWDYNEYRKNDCIDTIWGRYNKMNIPHFYHIGAKEKNRKPMIEAILINY